MEVSVLENFIKPEAMIMVPVLYLIGLLLERTPKIPSWVIPWVQVFVGIIFCLAYYGMIIEAVVQGILTAGAAVLLKDLIHKPIDAAKRDKKKDEEE